MKLRYFAGLTLYEAAACQGAALATAKRRWTVARACLCDARMKERAAEEPGSVIGHYKLLELIGEGGMRAACVAEQTEPVRRRAATKVIKPGMDTREVVARFEAERQALALMDHPHIAKDLDGGRAGERGESSPRSDRGDDSPRSPSGRPYFAKELVPRACPSRSTATGPSCRPSGGCGRPMRGHRHPCWGAILTQWHRAEVELAENRLNSKQSVTKNARGLRAELRRSAARSQN